jgi:CubicO group peptidase (beta-lactamase class C family)
MSRHSSATVIAVALFNLPGVVMAAEAPAAQDLAQRLDASIASYYKADEPGATIIVVKDGKTVFRKAYGLADVAKGVPLTPETTMRLGSITKQFTATAILMLADEGKLSLSDEITRFLPDFPTQGKKITIENLLTHTAGVANYTSNRDYVANMPRDMTLAQLIDMFKDEPLDFDPGTKWSYSNSGYVLLGAVIEKVSGMPYAKFVEQRIFVPLDMVNTAYEGYERKSNPHAVGHAPGEHGFTVARTISMTQPYAAGSLVSTVDDLARWDAAVSSGKLLKAASWQHAFTPYVLANGKPANYGYGWELGKLRGFEEISHNGSINGFNSEVLRLPTEHVYVAVLSNTRGGVMNPEYVAMKAAALMVGKPYPNFKAITLDPAKLDAFTGVYKGGPNLTRTFRHINDALVVQRTGGPRLKLAASSDNTFFIPEALGWYEFKAGANGAMTLITHAEDEDFTDQRVGPVVERKPVQISDAVFAARAGRYQFGGGMVIELTASDGHYFAQAGGQPKFEIVPISDNVFVQDDIDAEMRFDDPSHPEQVVMVQHGRKREGKKIQ